MHKKNEFELVKEIISSFNKQNIYTGISKKGYGNTYFTKRMFNPGEIVMKGFGRKIDHQTAHRSVQITPNTHYLGEKWTGVYWNHSCDPNTYIHTRPDGFPNLIALKKINVGDEITFAYWMSEFEWVPGADENWIECKCGSKNCRGRILSFSQLSRREQLDLIKRGVCAKYLSRLQPVAVSV